LRRVISIEDLAGVWDEEMNQVMRSVNELWETWKLTPYASTRT